MEGLEPADAPPTKKKKERGTPRWAPGGASGNGLSEKGLDGEMMVEQTLPGEGRCYRVIYEDGIGIRKSDSIGADRTGVDLIPGEVFEVKTEVRRQGRRYFELMDGRGWAFDWLEIDGEKVPLVELAAQLYTVAFPDGVNGIQWGSDTTLRFCQVQDFTNEGAAADMANVGVRPGDTLVMINEDPVVGMPFGQVLERVWATGGRQPGAGLFYKVTTDGPYGIGIRETPDVAGARTGEDLIRGTVFQVDEIIEQEEGPTYLHLADNRGWVFDTSPVSPENPSVRVLADDEVGCTLTMWRGSTDELAETVGLKLNKTPEGEGPPVGITVLEDGSPPRIIQAPAGTNLRKALLDNGFQVYTQMRNMFHCSAQQLCGTCVLHVLEGRDNLTRQSLNEQTVMAANPEGYRLCCSIDVYGDIAVRLRPPNVIYGGGTS